MRGGGAFIEIKMEEIDIGSMSNRRDAMYDICITYHLKIKGFKDIEVKLIGVLSTAQ